MCVAIYKPRHVPTPSLEILEQCWAANPDGAGFAMKTNESKYAIAIHKGFMSWAGFVRAFEQYHLADFEEELFLHFRIATHGKVSPGNTHPFCLTEELKLLRHPDLLTNYALMHNGMLPIEPRVNGISDTMELCRRLAKGDFQRNLPAVCELLEGFLEHNKIAIMTREQVYLLGEWELLDDVYFSNFHGDWTGFEETLFDTEWKSTGTAKPRMQ